MHHITQQLRGELVQNSDEATKTKYTRFFKEAVLYYGVPRPEMKLINARYWNLIKVLKKSDWLQIFEAMLSSDYCEEAFLVGSWLPKLKKQFINLYYPKHGTTTQ